MTYLHDPSFLTLEGEPITGRIPASVTVHGDEGISGSQLNDLSHVYQQFRDALKLSLVQYATRDEILDDGTFVRITSINGVDQVDVYPPSGNPRTQLNGRFFCVPVAQSPYTPADPDYSAAWAFRDDQEAPSELNYEREITDQEPELAQHPGNLTWWSDDILFNDQPIIVSWYGRATRYGRRDYYGMGTQWSFSTGHPTLYGPQQENAKPQWKSAFKSAVWTNGVKHEVYKTVGETQVPVPVMSAGLRQDEDGLYLYLVSHVENVLTVFRGAVDDPYAPGGIEVTQQFFIDFTVNATMPPSTVYHEEKNWETLLQPLYFNASCTKCAGIVSCGGFGSVPSINPSAVAACDAIPPTTGIGTTTWPYRACVIEVDLDASTTTFTAGHIQNSRNVVVLASTGGDTAGTNSSYVETLYQSYGAVDYVGDVLTIAILESIQRYGSDDTGSYTPSSATRTTVLKHAGGYRLFVHGTGELLANQPADVFTDYTTFHIDATDGFNGYDYGTASGYGSTYATEPFIQNALVEGGDLRHNFIIIGEVVDIGTTNVTYTFTHDTFSGSVYNPQNYIGGTYTNPGSLDPTFTNTQQQRQPNLRCAVWSDGVLLDTSTARKVHTNNIGVLHQRFLTAMSILSLDGSFVRWYPSGTPGTTTTTATDSDYVSGFISFEDDATGLSILCPYVLSGAPYVNTCAFSPDGKYKFYNVSAAHYYAGFTSPPSDFNSIVKFIIDGVSYTADQTVFMPEWSPDDPVLASPIFIDNVPEPT